MKIKITTYATFTGHWQYRLNEPFPDSGIGGGVDVRIGSRATFEVEPSINYTLYAALVQEDGIIETPRIMTSIEFTVAEENHDGDSKLDSDDAFPYDANLTVLPENSEELPITKNMTLWLDGDTPLGNQSIANNKEVGTWLNYSGNEGHAVIITGDVKPVYKTSISGDKGALYFSGDSLMKMPDAVIPSKNESYTMFVVMKSEAEESRLVLGTGGFLYPGDFNSLVYRGEDRSVYNWWHYDPIGTRKKHSLRK